MIIEVSDKNFEKEVLESKTTVLVDFWAQWCGPCRMVTPVIEAVAKEYEDKLKVCKVNVDYAPNTASQYDIMSIPTLAIFKKGKVVKRTVGALSKTDLDAEIKPYV
jgi:thioredoxin 1